MESILVTGGAGYIGSHVVKKLLQKNYNVVVYDNLSSGHRSSMPEQPQLRFVEGSLSDKDLLAKVFQEHSFSTVMHFAASIEVATSVSDPASYYKNNFVLTQYLLDTMRKHGVERFIFSSTAAIFGEPQYLPIDEKHPCQPCNPYGRSKLAVEWLLHDYSQAYQLRYASLRYFNASGAASDGSIGCSYRPATHLIAAALEAAAGEREKLQLFGNDYQTPDGTAIRDYIHIEDLAEAHLLALQYLLQGGKSECFNLGSGLGSSVQEVIDMVNKVVGKPIQVEAAPRRAGDPENLVASSAKAAQILGWKAQRNLQDMIKSAWQWLQNRSY